MRSLRGRLSGLCQPTYVLDIPGGFGKVPVGHTYLQMTLDDGYLVEDYRGDLHTYNPKPQAESAASSPKARVKSSR